MDVVGMGGYEEQITDMDTGGLNELGKPNGMFTALVSMRFHWRTTGTDTLDRTTPTRTSLPRQKLLKGWAALR
jgi:hypothetical protein